MIDSLRRLLLGVVLLGLTGIAFAQDKDKDKDKDKPKDKPTEPLKGKNQELIVGEWKTEVALEDMKKIKVQVKFGNDGTIVLTFESRMTKGKYKFTDDDNIVVEYTEGDTTTKEEMKVKVTGKTLELTSNKNKTQKFDRVE